MNRVQYSFSDSGLGLIPTMDNNNNDISDDIQAPNGPDAPPAHLIHLAMSIFNCLDDINYDATSAAEFLATLTQVPEFSFWRGPADVIEFFLTTIFHLDGLSPKEKSLLNGIAVSQHPSFGLIQELPLRVSKNSCSYSSCRRTQFSS